MHRNYKIITKTVSFYTMTKMAMKTYKKVQKYCTSLMLNVTNNAIL